MRPDPRRPWKAVAAAVVAFASLLWANMADRGESWATMSRSEWVAVLVPTVLAFVATYAVPNPADRRGRPGRRSDWFGSPG